MIPWFTDPDWWQVIVAVLALLAAVSVAAVAWHAYRSSYQPALRPVALWLENGAVLEQHEFKLKNVGRGAAVAVAVAEGTAGSEDMLVGEVDVVELLGELMGPQFDESKRAGSVKVITTGSCS